MSLNNIKRNQDFSRNSERTQDVEMKSRSKSQSQSSMKFDLPRSDPIFLNFQLWSYYRRREKSENYEGSDSNKNKSFWSENDMISEGSEDDIDENESQK